MASQTVRVGDTEDVDFVSKRNDVIFDLTGYTSVTLRWKASRGAYGSTTDIRAGSIGIDQANKHFYFRMVNSTGDGNTIEQYKIFETMINGCLGQVKEDEVPIPNNRQITITSSINFISNIRKIKKSIR